MSALVPAAPQPGFAARFLLWAKQAEKETRADAASLIARALTQCALPDARRDELLLALTALADDPEPCVRRALAEVLAGQSGAPRTLVVTLVNDVSAVAAPLLARSPVLTDAELAECAALGDAVAQCAIARRPSLGEAAALALATEGAREAVAALAGNCGSPLGAAAFERICARFRDDRDIREALAARPDATPLLKTGFALDKSEDEAASAQGERARRDAQERRDAALIAIVAVCRRDETRPLAQAMRARGALTVALLLRAALSGEGDFFAEALACLAEISSARASGLARARGDAFAALLHRAGLPPHAAPVFCAAFGALDAQGAGRPGALRAGLVSETLAAAEARQDEALAPILALLWRYAAEAASAEAREIAAEAERPAALLPPKLAFTPANDVLGRRLLLAVPAARRKAA